MLIDYFNVMATDTDLKRLQAFLEKPYHIFFSYFFIIFLYIPLTLPSNVVIFILYIYNILY